MNGKSIIKNILYIIQGAIVGVGAILPGVSGGVLCVAFGIYEPMMELLTHPRNAIRNNYKMFIPFSIGWAAGFTLLAKAVDLFFDHAPAVALMLFFGLICGTLPELFKKGEKEGENKSWTPFAISLSLAYLFFHLLDNADMTSIPPSFWGFILCGVLWGISLVVPGVSSSSILIYLGLYQPMNEGLGNLDPRVILPMLLGISVTALALARLVNTLYHKHYAVMSRIILGFVIASSLKVLPNSLGTPLTSAISLLCFAIGFAVARWRDVKSKY